MIEEGEITDKDDLIHMLRTQVDMLQEMVKSLDGWMYEVTHRKRPELPSIVFDKV